MKRYIGGLSRYLVAGICPGNFLTNVLENNLVGSISYADETAAKELREVVRLIYNYFPGDAWGSREKVNAWLERPEEERAELAGYEWFPYLERTFELTPEKALRL